jgi:hypothetical protein
VIYIRDSDRQPREVGRWVALQVILVEDELEGELWRPWCTAGLVKLGCGTLASDRRPPRDNRIARYGIRHGR